MKNAKRSRLELSQRFGVTAAVALLAMIPSTTRADTLTPPELATTAMTEALLGVSNFLAGESGTDAAHPLQFSTTVDSLGQSFSYSASGVYNGQQLSIVGTGAINAAGAWIVN